MKVHLKASIFSKTRNAHHQQSRNPRKHIMLKKMDETLPKAQHVSLGSRQRTLETPPNETYGKLSKHPFPVAEAFDRTQNDQIVESCEECSSSINNETTEDVLSQVEKGVDDSEATRGSTKDVSDRASSGDEPNPLIEATLIEEGERKTVIDALNVQIEESDDKLLRRLKIVRCSVLVLISILVAGSVAALRPDGKKSPSTIQTYEPTPAPTYDPGIDWTQRGDFIYGEDARDNSGRGMKLSNDGTVIAISAHNNDGVHGTSSGHVRVYKWHQDKQTWLQRGNDIDGPSPYAMITRVKGSLALSGEGNVVAFASLVGAAMGTYVYAWDTESNDWKQRGWSNIEGHDTPKKSGHDLSLSEYGNVLAISSQASNQDGSSGQVTVLKWVEKEKQWARRGEILAGNSELSDMSVFGASISLDSEGSTIAVSIPDDILADKGPEHSGVGKLIVFAWDGITWNKMGEYLEGFGSNQWVETVQLSGDGKTLVTLVDGLRVLTWVEDKWVHKGEIIEVKGGYGWPYLSRDGDRLALASEDDSGAWSCFLYEWSGRNWIRKGWKSIERGIGRAESMPMSVALSGNGQVLGISDSEYDLFVNETLTMTSIGRVSLFEWPLDDDS